MTTFVRMPLVLSGYKETGTVPLPDRFENYSGLSNPVHRHLKTAYFLAMRDNAPAGRIAAIKDFLNPDPETGFFGCFECEWDPGAASALIEKARQWLLDNGCSRMIGPATFNTNQQVGVLVDGAGQGPQLMLPHNPPYYGELMERAGLSKHTDLITYGWHRRMETPQKIREISERARQNKDVSIRRIAFRNIFQEARLVRDLFNGSMQANWGFVPLTIEETASMLNFCSIFADRDLMITIWVNEKPAGLLLFLPTALPGGTLPKSVRAAIFGVLPEFRHRGLDSCMIEQAIHTLLEKNYEYADLSMVHEENNVMIRILTRTIGAIRTRRYRIYGINKPP